MCNLNININMSDVEIVRDVLWNEYKSDVDVHIDHLYSPCAKKVYITCKYYVSPSIYMPFFINKFSKIYIIDIMHSVKWLC
jgi:hypothetical protein